MFSPAPDPGQKWWTGIVVCAICDESRQITIQIDQDAQEPLVPLECPSCGNVACTPP